MGAGALRHRIRFDEDAGTSSESTGEHAESLTEVCTRRAEFVEAGDNRLASLKARYPAIQFAFIVRRDSLTVTIAPGHRATWAAAGRAFDVAGAVDPDGRRQWLHVGVNERFSPSAVTP